MWRWLRRVFRWFRRRVRDPLLRRLEPVARRLRGALEDWGVQVEQDLPEMAAALAMAVLLYASGDPVSARLTWKQIFRFARAKRDALLDALKELLEVSADGAD